MKALVDAKGFTWTVVVKTTPVGTKYMAYEPYSLKDVL